MSFEQLIEKVKQAEDAVEAQERRVAANLRQLKASWRDGWTPGRIVLGGLVSGFLIGKAEPSRVAAKGTGIVQMISALSSLMASSSAQTAATGAEQAAESAETAAVEVAPTNAVGLGQITSPARQVSSVRAEAIPAE